VLALVLALLSGCAADNRTPLQVASDVATGFGGGPEAVRQQQALRQQQRSMDTERQIALPLEEVEYALTVQRTVYEATDDMFAALHQAKLQHFRKYGSNPELYRRLDELTVVLWGLDGGEMAEAECYIRGFQFGTAHHDQCVYEVKMEAGTGFSEPAAPPPASRAPQPRDKWPPPAVVGRVEQGGKVYDPSECIGPVIMGRCKGTILLNKAYHPTCYGTWLNGTCTGPIF
jgi:hypothetical protein